MPTGRYNKDMIRLAHFSDIHVSTSPLGWRLRDYFSKRLTSWANHRILRRWRKFALANEILTCMMDDIEAMGVDHVVFSGDATALGFEAELRRAAEVLRIGSWPTPALAIPGNHDYCTASAARSGSFERHFAAWQAGRRLDDAVYPFAQPVGNAWLVAVNAAIGNRWPWDAGGAVGMPQLKRLARLLADLGKGDKFLVVHYPVCLPGGLPEPRRHGLRDLRALLDVANAAGVRLWLHGHQHAPYYLQSPQGAAFPVICAGSATLSGRWSYLIYTISNRVLQASRRAYDPIRRCFHEVETFSLAIP
jgi:3',5'-cyclic AMP phosphodiesterase CpdA